MACNWHLQRRLDLCCVFPISFFFNEKSQVVSSLHASTAKLYKDTNIMGFRSLHRTLSHMHVIKLKKKMYIVKFLKISTEI